MCFNTNRCLHKVTYKAFHEYNSVTFKHEFKERLFKVMFYTNKGNNIPTNMFLYINIDKPN